MLVQLSAQVKMISFENFKSEVLSNFEISDEQRKALYPLYFNSPLIDEAEFRTETNEFDLAQMEYTLRLSSNSKEIRKYQNRIYQNLKNQYLFELKQSIEDEIEQVYMDYIQYYFNVQKLNLRKRILPIYEDIITILSKEDLDGDLSVTDLIEASIARDKLKQRIDNAETKMTLRKEFAGEDTQELISVDLIQKFLGQSLLINDELAIEEHRLELTKIENLYQMEKAERDKILDFAQIRYQSNPEDPWQEKVSIGFGFRFPHSSKNSLDMIELQLERMIEEEKFERSKREQEENVSKRGLELQEQIDEYFATYDIIQQLNKYSKLIEALKPSSKREIVNILKLNIESIEEDINLLDVKEELYESYIEYSKTLGLLDSPQYPNLLSIKLLDSSN